MKNLFETTISFFNDAQGKRVKQLFLVDSFTFGEVEIRIVTYLKDLMGENEISVADIGSMRRVAYDDIVFEVKDGDYSWFEANVKVRVDVDKDDNYKYLVADENMEKATQQLKKYLQDTDGEFRISVIKEKEIDDLILYKKCCDECDLCDSTTRVVSFDEQKRLDMKFAEVDEKKALEMIELGAYHVSMSKYKMMTTEENLEKAKGKRLGGNVVREFTEDFVDDDTAEVVQIQRKEIVIPRGSVIGDEEIAIIKENGVVSITLYKD